MEKRIPRRRFKEFVGSGPWEEKRLGEVLDSAIKGKAKVDAGYGENLYLDVDFLNGGKREYINSPKNVKKEDVLILWDGSKAGTVYYGFEGALGSTLKAYKAKESGSFLFYYLTKQEKIIFTQFRTPNIPHVVKDFEKEFNVPIPYLAEQEKIGHFFQKLDRLIEINREKLDKLKASKSAYLTEMFPREGEDRPRRRFKGFTGAWEENKFEDILDSSEGIRRGPFGSALKKDCFVKRSIYVVYEQRNAIEDKYDVRYYITKEKYDELSNFHLKPGDYIMSGAGTIGCISRVPKNIKKGVFNQALIRIRINDKLLNDNYFLIWMRSPNMQKRLTGANPASAMVNLVPMVELKEWSVLIPSLAEQEKIGHLFKKLDQQIEVQEEKLEKLEKMKKAYLAEMFV